MRKHTASMKLGEPQENNTEQSKENRRKPMPRRSVALACTLAYYRTPMIEVIPGANVARYLCAYSAHYEGS